MTAASSATARRTRDRRRVAPSLLILWTVWAAQVAADPAAPGLRALTTDRPDATESPFTVDPGHLQVELDAATWTRDSSGGVRTTTWEVAPFNLRLGLTERLEAGIFLSPQVFVAERADGRTIHDNGFGDTTLRGKVNVWGNDSGATALGVIADLVLPTAGEGLGNDKVEGALRLPVTFELGAGWAGAAMSSLAFVDAGEAGYETVWENTLTVARSLGSELGMFLELTSAMGEGTHVATFNVGFTHLLTPALQLDVGSYVGISRAAPDATVFCGLSRKF